MDAVSKEAGILASLRHPNIVTFYGMWENKDEELSSWTRVHTRARARCPRTRGTCMRTCLRFGR